MTLFGAGVRQFAVLATSTSVGLAGCASYFPTSSHWPTPPDELEKPFDPLPSSISSAAAMATVSTKLAELSKVAAEKAAANGARDWSSGDVITAGGLAAVVGGLADRMGLINLGAGLALAGGAARSRYQYEVQQGAYRNAIASFTCVNRQVSRFNDAFRVIVITLGDRDEKLAAIKAPDVAVDAVEKIRAKLLVALKQVSSEPATRESLESLAEKFKKPPPVSNTASGAATNLRGNLSGQGVAASLTANIHDATWVIDEAKALALAFSGRVDACTL